MIYAFTSWKCFIFVSVSDLNEVVSDSIYLKLIKNHKDIVQKILALPTVPSAVLKNS